ncbi:MAG: hypothetical protein HY812_05120 [Planctomycetes bacterium]|nr:hypothetical protein [Planctomycetota bacterium]
MQGNHDCGCCVSRRHCLKVLSAAAAVAGLGRGLLAGQAGPEGPGPADHVDAASLRPRPEVRVAAAFLRMPPPYWLGWPGTTYDLEGHQQEYLGLFEDSSRRLGITAAARREPIETEDGVEELLKEVRETRPDGLLVTVLHMSCWRWAERLAREAGVPLVVFAPVGTAFTGHVRQISRMRGVHVVSSLEWPAVEAGLRMIRAKRLFEESRVLWIQGEQRSETVLDRLGTKVRAVPRRVFNEMFDAMPVTDEVRQVAADLRRGAERIVEPTEEDTVNCARAFTTAKRLLALEQSNALSMDCLGMVGAKLVPTPPCGAWMLLQDVGVTAGCEADLYGAMSLMLTSYLLDRPGYMNDPVPETAKNLLIAAHCTSGSRIRGFTEPAAPYVLRDHSESSLGVSIQILWPVGEPVTLVRFEDSGSMIVDTGVVVANVDTPPAGGCRTSIEIAMDNVADVRDVLGFHQVVTLGSHRAQVEGFCQLYGIDVLRSPAGGAGSREG